MVNATTDIFTAIKEGDLDAVRRLVAADPALARARNEQGISAILFARYQFRMNVVDILLAARPELDIFEAAALGDTGRVAEILESDPTMASAYAADGFTPLHLAAFFGHTEAARLLLDHGAGLSALSRNQLANMPLHSGAAGRSHEVCALLVARGADVNARQHGGYTPLHEAAQNGNRSLVDLLLAHAADPLALTDEGKTPADLAAGAGHEEIAALLR